MNPILVRPCLATDLPAVRALLAQLEEVASSGGGLSLEELAAMYDEMEAAPDVYLNLVAVSGENVLGFISLVFYKTFFHKGGTALINELVVSSAARGKGIGRMLIEQAQCEALARGMDELEVGTEEDNTAAQKFYRACGFDGSYVLLGMEFDEV